jgi:hypothetical protein
LIVCFPPTKSHRPKRKAGDRLKRRKALEAGLKLWAVVLDAAQLDRYVDSI